jgi:hypothetical protein
LTVKTGFPTSLLVVSKASRLIDYKIGNFEVTEIKINLIKDSWYWNTHSTFFGILIGAALGLALGAIIGQDEEDDTYGSWFYESAETKAHWDMIGCTVIGGAAGALFSQFKIRIPINGSLANYNKYKSTLEKRSVKYKYFTLK